MGKIRTSPGLGLRPLDGGTETETKRTRPGERILGQEVRDSPLQHSLLQHSLLLQVAELAADLVGEVQAEDEGVVEGETAL